MKIFALYATLQLTDTPAWFDAFRERYDQPWAVHLTLIQPRRIDDEAVEGLKRTLGTFFSTERMQKIPLSFREVTSEQDSEGMDIFLHTEPSGKLMELQQNLRAVVAEYKTFVDPRTAAYETTFKPPHYYRQITFSLTV